MTTGPTREEQRRTTWRALQLAAVDLVERHGLDQVTVEQIAERAGVSRRTFFNHFPTKAAALFDPDPSDAERLHELLSAATGAGSAWALLRDVCVSFVAGHEDVLAVRRRLVAESPELEQYHRAAHRHAEIAIGTWTRSRPELDEFTADLMAQAAAGVMIAAFAGWHHDSDPAQLPGLVRRGFGQLAIDATQQRAADASGA